jgi:putative membrane protein
MLLVSHGCASHDLNLISNRETKSITKAIRESLDSVIYTDYASRPIRTRFGTVSILSQRFGDSLLMITTRSPEMTEDMDYSIGRIVMGESKGRYKNIGFVDAHNCMTAVTNIIYPSTKTGNEFISGADDAMNRMLDAEMLPFSVGVAQIIPPFGRGEGFADMGIIAMVTEVAGIKTAYVLFDGNNVHLGVREILRNAVLGLGLDEVEIMTTDSHVVNSISGRNPIGDAVSPGEIIPYVSEAVLKAVEDLAPASGGAATNICEEVEVFGPSRIVQLTSTVNAIVTNLLPLATLLMATAFLLILVVCMIVL